MAAVGTNFSLESLIKNVLSGMADQDAVGVAVKDTAAKQQDLSKQVQDIIRQIGTDAETVEKNKATAEKGAQVATREIADAAGGARSKLIESAQRYQRDVDEARARRDALQRKDDINIFKEPSKIIEFVVHQLGRDGVVDWASQPARNAEATAKEIVGLNNIIQETATTQNLVKEPIGDADILARARTAKNQAELQAAAVEREALKSNLDAIKTIADVSRDRLNMIFSVRNAQETEARLRLAEKGQKLQFDEFEYRKVQDAKREVASKEKDGNKLLDDETLTNINTAEAILGLEPSTPEQNSVKLARFKGGASKEMYLLEQIGARARSSGANRLGTSPSEALAIAKLFQNRQNLPVQQVETIKYIAEIERALQQDPRNQGKKPEELQGTLDTLVNEDVKQQLKAFRKDSLFDIGDLSNYLGKNGEGIKSMSSLPVAKKLLIPLSQSGVSLADPKEVMALVLTAVKDGKITSSEALGMSEIYLRASQINQQARGLIKFGIIPEEMGRQFNVKLPTGLLQQETVDIADAAAFNTYLIQNLAGANKPTLQRIFEKVLN